MMDRRVGAIASVMLTLVVIAGCATNPDRSRQAIGTAKVKPASVVKADNSSQNDASGTGNATKNANRNGSSSTGNTWHATGDSSSGGGSVTPVDSPPANEASTKWTDPTTLPPIRYWNMNHYKSFADTRLVPEVYRLPQGEVALTIDDGPSPYTAQILKVLEKYHAHVTFFDVGKMIKIRPSVVKQAVADGDLVEDHSMTHPDFFTITPEEQAQQINQDAHLIYQLTGQPVRLFRPPYENFNDATEQILQRDGMGIALWNRDPRDWAAKNSQQIVQAVLGNNPSGAVFDMHDKPLTLQALPAILQGLEKMHLKLVVLPTPKLSPDLNTGSKPIPLTASSSGGSGQSTGQTVDNRTTGNAVSSGNATNQASPPPANHVANQTNSTHQTNATTNASKTQTNTANASSNTTPPANATVTTGGGNGSTNNTTKPKSANTSTNNTSSANQIVVQNNTSSVNSPSTHVANSVHSNTAKRSAPMNNTRNTNNTTNHSTTNQTTVANTANQATPNSTG